MFCHGSQQARTTFSQRTRRTGISINKFEFEEEPIFLGGRLQRTIEAATTVATTTT
jgi:hypothetical protein